MDTAQTIRDLVGGASRPIASNPELHNHILELRATLNRVIDEVNNDILLEA